MASIFTYDPDPPRVSSPWLSPAKDRIPKKFDADRALSGGLLSDYGLTQLEAEPQEGPTEYKLHLLLRPRRTYSSSSTGSVISGSNQGRQQSINKNALCSANTLSAPSNASRQKRLEQLTTQLLWRLQQSSPFHVSAPNDLVLPLLPEASEVLNSAISAKPAKLIAGLEESRGALYEIGVADDGTLVGLTEDEMDESLSNLKSMAASLGCTTQILRKLIVGHCVWHENADASPIPLKASGDMDATMEGYIKLSSSIECEAALWVAEIFVTPDLGLERGLTDASHSIRAITPIEQTEQDRTIFPADSDHTEQLRVTLTGPTTSGKSSLLGVLSMATLDNGRGMSRLSLLKHRHEIETGITSSVAQELVGYASSRVVNYAADDISSWVDIQDAADDRTVLVSDSAGHPRYRRTIVRGLMGWAPHWILLCIAADNSEKVGNICRGTSSVSDVHGAAGAGVNLVKAHLDLCLKLHKPLAIIVTKLDLASKSTLRRNLSMILSAIKESGRMPSIIPPEQARRVVDADLRYLNDQDIVAVRPYLPPSSNMSDGLNLVVPIVMTSAVSGTGIKQLHATLKTLPIPPLPTIHDLTGLALNPEQPSSLFHIEDVFERAASFDPLVRRRAIESGRVVAGHVRFGCLWVGASIVVGPFPSANFGCESRLTDPDPRCQPPDLDTSALFPHSTNFAPMASRNILSASATKGEWHNARVVSIRNLRRPVQSLGAGKVGTIGLTFEDSTNEGHQHLCLRKGMVVAIPSWHMLQTGHTLQAASGFTAAFDDCNVTSITAGTLVVVYIASVRASARVVSSTAHGTVNGRTMSEACEDDVAIFRPLEQQQSDYDETGVIAVTFELLKDREWVELGSQILCMPDGGHGLYHGSVRGEKGIAGLQGFVGKVSEIVE